MERASGTDSAAAGQGPRCSRSAAGIVALALAAAWLAAGSGGMLGEGFQRALTWLLLGTMVVLGWPKEFRLWKSWGILAIAVVAAGAMMASSIAVVNILAVVIILSAIASLRGGIDARAMLLGTVAVFLFAVYRLAFCSIPVVWHLAQTTGSGMGKLASLLTCQKLSIGAAFGGIDFLVPMLVLLVIWGTFLQRPRRRPIIMALVAIIIVQIIYIALVAYSEKLLACLPDPFFHVETDPDKVGVNNVGVWAWQNMVRAWLPWNLPMVAVVLQAIVAAGMMRWGLFKPGGQTFLSGHAETGKNACPPGCNRDNRQSEVVSLGNLVWQVITHCGPPILAAVLALSCTLSLSKSDLTGKTILALDSENSSWSVPEYSKSAENGYGLLPCFIESLGGKFIRVKNLAEADLSRADLLLILHPNEILREQDRTRLEKYLDSGGRLLVGADPETNTSDPFFSVRDETAVPLVEDWEQSYEQLNTPATVGLSDARNPFGFQRSTVLDVAWSVRPLVVGRWGWSEPGRAVAEGAAPQWELRKPLGDLVLAAERSVGKGWPPEGKIVTLGDVRCLSNDVLPTSYPFVGRLLSVLADKETSDPGVPWRQAVSIVVILLLIVLFIGQRRLIPLTISAVVLAAGVALCSSSSFQSRRVLPHSDGPAARPIAYLDASHLEAYSSRLWSSGSGGDYGVAGLARVLMRNGYLPLRLPELTAEQLQPAKLLISIAPARSFSAEERETVRQFVEQGGTFLCLVGAEEAGASAKLLDQFQFAVPPTPVLPGEKIQEAEPWYEEKNHPLTVEYTSPDDSKKYRVQFFASWEVQSPADDVTEHIFIDNGRVKQRIVVSRSLKSGVAAVIADTHFASNQNLETLLGTVEDNLQFWRWLLPRITGYRAATPADKAIPESGIREEGPDEG
ncbi:MAG: hypothetical protein JXB10_07865 [Pirellulales bacterium]|nr:hypothetical protein [Pirellulales bacterium]